MCCLTVEPRSPTGLLFPSQCPSGTIMLTPYSMVWDWQVSRADHINAFSCGWKHTIAFHKSSQDQQTPGAWSVIGNRGEWWTFRNWGDIGLSPARRATTQTNKLPKHYTKTGVITSVLSRKRGNLPNAMGHCHHEGPSQTRDA